MNIIVFAMLLWFAAILIFKLILRMQALHLSNNGTLYIPDLPGMENNYPGYKKETFLLPNQKGMIPGYFENNYTFIHGRYYTKKYLIRLPK